MVPQIAQDAERRGRRLADDEPVRHVTHAGGRGGADRGAAGLDVGHPHRRGQRRRGVGDLAQELAQVAGEVVERTAGRRDVDEPEQRRAQLPVGRGQVHRPLVDRPERVAGARGKCRGQIGADLADRPLEVVLADRHAPLIVVPAHYRMLTARATTRPTVTSEAIDCALISHLAVEVSGIVSVGLKAVAFVSETYR